jgi:hypothetical protein
VEGVDGDGERLEMKIFVVLKENENENIIFNESRE